MFFCPRCGADRRRVAPIAPCPGCGSSLTDDHSVRPATEAEVADIELHDEHGTRRSRWLVVGVIATSLALVLASVVLVAAWSGSRSGSPGNQPAGVVARNVVQEPAAPPPPQMPKWVTLRVERVQLLERGVEWDGPVKERSLAKLCKDVGSLVGLAKPEIGGAMRVGCPLLGGERQRQADPRDPDLEIRVDAGNVSYSSYVASDRRSHLFAYSFVVPGDAIPQEGLVLSVLDADDGADRGQEIGSLRLTREEIIAMASASSIVTRSAGGIELFEFTVRPHDGRLRKVELTLPAKKGGIEVRGIDVNAGDVVRIEASGSWRIGDWWAKDIGPHGYPGGGPTESNLPLFSRDAHGAAVAVVGQQGRVALLRPRPCERFVSNFAGVVWVGVNDEEPGDNKGEVRVRVLTRAPKDVEWRSPGVLLGCDP